MIIGSTAADLVYDWKKLSKQFIETTNKLNGEIKKLSEEDFVQSINNYFRIYNQLSQRQDALEKENANSEFQIVSEEFRRIRTKTLDVKIIVIGGTR